MKKWGIVSVLFLFTLGLSGCMDLDKKIKIGMDTTKEQSEEKIESLEDDVDDEETETFEDGVLTTDKFTIEIESAKVIPSYDKEKQIVVITYSFTNTSDELLIPERCFSGSFGVTQDLPDTVEDLYTGFPPYDSGYSKLQEKSQAKVKEGKTIQAVASYDLKEKSNTVVLTAYSTTNTLSIGEEKLHIK
ncbi:hypothetical protein RV11_GL003018 [Enterococcus phoeniculicola]|jgi:hypothetical protein|uniref:DUF5067 domain-containing protein n=1 Tax=Enterococcus phoeniculicola ATCC BAA-412 TaxID=1158610 RepID=R3TMG1_9ENTE|nr:DUF5067 domain-containing protein [Enterococcus phoeniculicola]EOL42694.1 hypothetical protein UC3_03047 [Enterococcus phoeniculicola ATCC BAA-412]EOT79022.1 hypothetical protein I589_00529 [Enterococcus phoeniculicola ATCC BAA-412]OJG72436.1 hypothetical protein RV11_GL003018 [Enterococcus phoeniculicola]